MKRGIAIFISVLLLSAKGYAQCTPQPATGNPGLSPPAASVTCIERGVFYDFTMYFENFSGFNCSGFSVDINSASIDNLSNLPCGLTWQPDRTSYSSGQTGCIRITGTTTDPIGQYALEVSMTFDLDILGSSYTVSGTIAQLQQQLQQFSCSTPAVNTNYYSRVVAPGTSPCPAIGSMTNRTSSGTTCPPPVSVSISGNDTICTGSSTTLTANVSNAIGGVTYAWSSGGGSGQTANFSPTSTTPYSVTVIDQNGSATASSTVTVIPPCNDNNACTTDNCVPGTGCVFTAIAPCNDNDACTTDNCIPATGCVFTAITPCNDSDGCTTDNCVPATGCVYTTILCDDGDLCTTDTCTNGSCVFTAIAPCNDNNACTTDNCVPATGCVFTAISCDDGDLCTTDACVNGPCAFTPIPGCTNPCDTLVCNDADLCTTDTCLNGQCEYTAIICDDADTCTINNCVPATGCVFTPIVPCSVGIANTDNSLSVEIYPNPTTGAFEMRLNNTKEDEFLLNIFDLSGKNLYSEAFTISSDKSTIHKDISGLSKGIYIFSLSSEKISINEKLVIY